MGKTDIVNKHLSLFLSLAYLLLIPGILLFFPVLSHADDSLCAEVKIEIKQELTLERQAFDAHMSINNGLSHITLENVDVDVSFFDEEGNSVLASSDPDNTDAVFFISVDSMENIEDVDGAGTVAPSSSADIHWLIIPAPGASNGVEQGTLYYVGATLTYTIGGEDHVTEVSPDYIFVKPMPELTLDYFLPSDVYGDDAFTPEIEPSVPFSLGLRVKNNGFGAASELKIDTAQPKIVDNEQGLLIGFVIEESEVNGEPATESLLVDLGDIEPDTSGVARWIMTCTLSGRFVEFEAEFSHSDELGGELTSLIDSVNTHFLVHDVLVDLSGRDSIRDFLAKDESVYKIFESDSEDTEVTDQSASSSLQFNEQSGSETRYTLSTPVTAGFMYVQLSDPHGGQKVLKEAVRSDGKQISENNIWLSKTRDEDHNWHYFINLFDVNTTDSYTIKFDDASSAPQSPVLQFISDKSGVEGQQISFMVEASDPDGTIPLLSAAPLPAGADFTDARDGTGIFDWTPAVGQAGTYEITFTASDGSMEYTRQVVITINSANDADADGMDDAWEMEHFGTLNRDGSGDFDGDGISDLDEFLNGTDPSESNRMPSIPEIQAPMDGDEVIGLQPDLVIVNSTDLNGDTITYAFEVCAGPEMTTLTASASDVPEGTDATSWTVPAELDDNTWYFWRVKATDGYCFSQWAYGSFFVNTANDTPGAFHASSPRDNSEVDTRAPVLEVTNSADVDEDVLTYTFEVYTDSSMSTLIASAADITEGENGTTSWVIETEPALDEGTWYFWRAVASDEHGAQVETTPASFYVNTANNAPMPPVLSSPLDGSEVDVLELDLVVGNSIDEDGDVISYYFEMDKVDTFDSPALQTSGEIPEGTDTTGWHVSGLEDNTLYYWRANASDGAAESIRTTGSFFASTANDAPLTPCLKNPGENAWVETLTPAFEVNPSTDPDNDNVIYRFEIYADESLTNLIAQGQSSTTKWTISQELADSIWYYWRVQAEDEHGMTGEWMDAASFYVRDDGVNDPPEITILEVSGDVVTNNESIMIRWEDSDPDNNAVISLYYDTDNSGEDGTLIIEGIEEDPDGTDDSYTWYITGIEGAYYIYAVISDGSLTTTSYSQGFVTIDGTPPLVEATPVGGTYDSTVSVTLFANETADIYYTIDGIEPTDESFLYTHPVETNETTTLKFMGIDSAGNQSEVITEIYTIQETQDLLITVETDTGIALSGLNVYAFTEAASYTGIYETTDEDGTILFNPENFTEGTYKFRVDYLGQQFWSDVIALPGTFAVNIIIEEETVEVTVTKAAGPAEGVGVYLFSENGSYLSTYEVTDENGLVSFNLPVGRNFLFRADILGSQYWTDVTTISGGGTNSVPVDAGGGFFQVTVQKDTQNPMEEVNVYLFSETGSYLSLYQVTDSSGIVGFDVSEGTYKVRADYLGYQFWSPATCVSTDTDIDLFISHQDAVITVNGVFQGTDEPLEEIYVYLFTPSGSYVSQYRTTDESGQAVFNLPEQSYKIRADYLGQQFWSEEFTWQDTDVNIPMAGAEITVTGSGLPLDGINVYVFSVSGSYLGIFDTTDVDGNVTFRIPAGSYKFRADYLGTQYWSDEETLIADQENYIEISTGGGSFTFTVLKGDVEALEGVKCYVFSENGSYLSMNETSNSDGQVFFDLTDGAYKIRVDYLGYQFWSEVYNVPDTLSGSLTIAHQDVAVTVNGVFQGADEPLDGINVYLFTPSGSYLSWHQVTDASGQVVFNLPEQPYKIRADYLGQQFWSEKFTWQDTDVNLSMADALITVSGSGLPLEGIPVYVFSVSGSYLSMYETTGADGQVTFRIPAGSYKFRADYLGTQYWSDEETLIADQENYIEISTGGGSFTFTVLKGDVEALEGVKCYVFSEGGSYLSMNETSNSDGQVFFDLTDGAYKIRVDYLGYQFWSDVYGVPDTFSGSLTIAHQDAVITVNGLFQGAEEPLEGIKVYLFTPSGSYQSLYRITDANGQVVFNLPEKPYKIRADYLGQRFWSEEFTWQNTTVTINRGLAEIHAHRSGIDVESAKVYLFSETGSYLRWYKTTDENGMAEFLLPDRSFKFRVDEGGDQVWSPVIDIIAGEETIVEMDLD